MNLGIKGLIGGAALALSIAAGTFGALDAHAAYTICRTDPLFYLSNKHWVQVSASFTDDQANISHITYTVHGPAGTTLSKVTYSSGWSKGVESVRYLADQPANTYTTDLLIATVSPSQAAVSGQTIIDNQTTSVKTTLNYSGVENAHITVTAQVS